MDAALDILSWVCLVSGGIFYVIGAVGLIRMPDVFTRMHAVSVSDTLGVVLMITGMALQSGLTLVTVKLGIILLVLMVTGPVASHALARAALHDGRKPLLTNAKGELVETDSYDISLELGARLTSPLVSEQVEEVREPVEEEVVVVTPDVPVDTGAGENGAGENGAGEASSGQAGSGEDEPSKT